MRNVLDDLRRISTCFRPWKFFYFLIINTLNSSEAQKQLPELPHKKALKSFINFSKFIGKHLCRSLFFNKIAGLIKKETDTSVFLWILRNFSENLFYRTPLPLMIEKNLDEKPRDIVKTSYELRVTSWKLKSTSWNSNPRVTSSNPRAQESLNN